jgi:hypothetical protein
MGQKRMMESLTRRQFIAAASAASAAAAWPASGAEPASNGLHRISKELFIPTQNETGVFPGFIAYLNPKDPVLLHRFGWVDASDTYDNFHESVSVDNGQTWSEPELKVKSISVDGGLIRYVENAAILDEESNRFFVFVSKMFYPGGKFDADQSRTIEISERDVDSGAVISTEEVAFDRRGGVGCSFCFPIKTRGGRLVVPTFSARVDEVGNFVHHPKSRTNIYDVHMMLGEYKGDGTIGWRLGESIAIDDALSTRGLSESTPVQLKDGRLALLCRGSNAGAPELPGYKWLCFSEDEGQSWTSPVPFTCDDGSSIESSATGGALFRSIKNGKLYFIGNLCTNDVPANGNWPREPLFIAEVAEDPFGLRPDTMTIIDRKQPTDSDRIQISNFRYYQDRESGDVVVFTTRFGENDAQQWKKAGYYRYRVGIA